MQQEVTPFIELEVPSRRLLFFILTFIVLSSTPPPPSPPSLINTSTLANPENMYLLVEEQLQQFDLGILLQFGQSLSVFSVYIGIFFVCLFYKCASRLTTSRETFSEKSKTVRATLVLYSSSRPGD